jgi:DNA-binding GntR family transcriptional regulator
MTRQATVSRSVLSEQVKDRLLQAILDGRYPPGARIVETRVARELGTSQAPVREALRDLEGLGVVETAAFRGARVRRPSAAELVEAFAVRSVLEALAARLAIPRLTDADLDELAAGIAEMQAAADAGDTHAEAMADAAFHGRMLELAGNATLMRVWRTLEPFSRTYITIVSPGSDRRRIADHHVPVLDALRRRDPELAGAVLREHFENAAAGLASHWPDRRPDATPAEADSPAEAEPTVADTGPAGTLSAPTTPDGRLSAGPN